MTDWLDSERERQARLAAEQQHAEQDKTRYQRDVQAFIDSNETIALFAARLFEYVNIAKAANVGISCSVSGHHIHLFNCIRPNTHYRKDLVREFDMVFSYERKGYVVSVYEGYAWYRSRHLIETGVVFKRDVYGDFRFETEYSDNSSGAPPGWRKIERFGGPRSLYIPLSDLDSEMAKSIVTWMSDRNNAITFGTQTIETNVRAKAEFHETFLSEDSFSFGLVGAFIGFIVGFFKGCSIANGSVEWSVVLVTIAICGIIGVVIGSMLRAWAEH